MHACRPRFINFNVGARGPIKLLPVAASFVSGIDVNQPPEPNYATLLTNPRPFFYICCLLINAYFYSKPLVLGPRLVLRGCFFRSFDKSLALMDPKLLALIKLHPGRGDSIMRSGVINCPARGCIYLEKL